MELLSAICGADVRSNEWSHGSERCQETALHTEVWNSGEHCSNSGSTQAAHQTYLLPGQLLEPGLGFRSRDARAIWLGLGKGTKCVAAYFDNPSWSIEIVPWINPLSMQERLHWTLQVCQSWTEVHCIVFLFWRLLACDIHKDWQISQAEHIDRLVSLRKL